MSKKVKKSNGILLNNFFVEKKVQKMEKIKITIEKKFKKKQKYKEVKNKK